MARWKRRVGNKGRGRVTERGRKGKGKAHRRIKGKLRRAPSKQTIACDFNVEWMA